MGDSKTPCPHLDSIGEVTKEDLLLKSKVKGQARQGPGAAAGRGALCVQNFGIFSEDASGRELCPGAWLTASPQPPGPQCCQPVGRRPSCHSYDTSLLSVPQHGSAGGVGSGLRGLHHTVAWILVPLQLQHTALAFRISVASWVAMWTRELVLVGRTPPFVLSGGPATHVRDPRGVLGA